MTTGDGAVICGLLIAAAIGFVGWPITWAAVQIASALDRIGEALEASEEGEE